MAERSTVGFLAAAAAAAEAAAAADDANDEDERAVKISSLRDRIESVLSGVNIECRSPTKWPTAIDTKDIDCRGAFDSRAPSSTADAILQQTRVLAYDFFSRPSSIPPGEDEGEAVGADSTARSNCVNPSGCGASPEATFSMLADMCLILDDGTRMYVSRAIVGMWSRVINEILTAMPETREISMRRMSAAEMVVVLTFMYPPPWTTSTESISAVATSGDDGRWNDSMSEGNVPLLLSFAEMYDCPAMKARCEHFLIRHVTDLGTRMATTSTTKRRTSSQNATAGQSTLSIASVASDASSAATAAPASPSSPPQLSIAQVLELSRDFHCHDRLRHVCEAVLMLRQTSFPNIDNFLIAQEFNMRLLADICEEWMIHNFESIKHDKRLSSINHDTFVRIAAGAFDNLKTNIEITRAGLRRSRSVSTLALRRTRTTIPAPSHQTIMEASTSYDNPLFSDVDHAHALFRLQMRATNARVPGRVANIIREYEHGTEPEDGSITLSSLLAHHENQQERMQLRRDYGSSQPSTLDTLLQRMRRTRTIS